MIAPLTMGGGASLSFLTVVGGGFDAGRPFR
jgi:hypothetical protein